MREHRLKSARFGTDKAVRGENFSVRSEMQNRPLVATAIAPARGTESGARVQSWRQLLWTAATSDAAAGKTVKAAFPVSRATLSITGTAVKHRCQERPSSRMPHHIAAAAIYGNPSSDVLARVRVSGCVGMIMAEAVMVVPGPPLDSVA